MTTTEESIPERILDHAFTLWNKLGPIRGGHRETEPPETLAEIPYSPGMALVISRESTVKRGPLINFQIYNLHPDGARSRPPGFGFSLSIPLRVFPLLAGAIAQTLKSEIARAIKTELATYQAGNPPAAAEPGPR